MRSWRKRTAMSSFFSQGGTVGYFRDNQSRAAALYRCGAVHALSGCALQCGTDARRGLCPAKQDVLCKQSYHHEVPEDAEFLTKSYFRYFEGREFTEIRTYLILTQEAQHSQFVQYDPKRWLDFHSKVSKVSDILKEKNIKHRKLTKEEVNEYCHRFMAFQFRHGPFSMTNFKASDEYLKSATG